jgi:serine/threonine-protein kinase
VKVLDFGISKVTTPGSDMGMTKTSAIVGSPLYMSPEQMRSAKSVDARTDIWSLGAILYELLSGLPPFTGESLPELCVNIMNTAPASLQAMRPDLPARLEAVVLRCLEKDRQSRYGNIAELAVALAEFAPRQAGNSVERIARVIRAAGISSSTFQLPEGAIPFPPSKHIKTHASWGSTSPGRPATRAPLFVVLGIGVLAVGGAGVWIGARSRGTAATAETPPPAAVDTAREAPAIAGPQMTASPEPALPAGLTPPADAAGAARSNTPSSAAPAANTGRMPASPSSAARPMGGVRPSRPETRTPSAPQTPAPSPAPPGDIFQDRQ